MAQRATLVPLDGSNEAEAVLPYAETIARLQGTAIRLITVVESNAEEQWSASDEVRAHLGRIRRETAQTYVDSVALTVQRRGIEVRTHVVIGEVVESLLEAADEDEIAIIAMTTHGRGGAKRLLLGSIADKLMRLATKPTLLVRGGEPHEQRREVALKRIMVPLDGSTLAESALPAATELAQAARATLVLVRAERSLWETIPPTEIGGDLTQADNEITETIERYLEEVQARLPRSVKSEVAVYRGLPPVILEELALHEDVDLVVMATHGRGGLKRLVLGSVADRMVRLGAPTLLIHAATPANT